MSNIELLSFSGTFELLSIELVNGFLSTFWSVFFVGTLWIIEADETELTGLDLLVLSEDQGFDLSVGGEQSSDFGVAHLDGDVLDVDVVDEGSQGSSVLGLKSHGLGIGIVGGAGNGGKRTIAAATPKFYPTVDVPAPLKNNKHAGVATLRANITPGTICILLAGPFRGKRVVFLKQLESGLILVTGPYSVNGVPLRRVNQRFVIATSTIIKAEGAAKDVNDAFFARSDKKAKSKKGGGEGKFFTQDSEKEPVSDARKAGQKKVDASIEKGVSADQKAYLKDRKSVV